MTDSQSPLISIVSPVFRAEPIVHKLVAEIIKHVTTITDDFEIILVDDCSPDNSWQRIEECCEENQLVKGIKLSRNFGQHYAITAGLEVAMGQWIVVMDCDLQDRPQEIPNLFAKATEGYDLVLAQRVHRQDRLVKRMSSKAFYALFSYLTNTKQDSSVANFGIYHRKVVQAILSMKDQIRYLPTMSSWVGFRRFCLPVQHAEREKGDSTYSFRALFKLAFDNMIAFSDKPLWLAVKFGVTISFMSVLVGVYFLARFLQGKIEVLGYASLILSIWFLSGIIIFILGVVGIYIGKTFEKVKGRPLYIVQTTCNFDS